MSIPRDLLELYAVPGLAGILPWSLCFPLYRRLAAVESLYRHEVDAACVGVTTYGTTVDMATWRQRARLVKMIDHADFYHSRLRTDGWIADHVHVNGQWPQGSDPFIAITFHWGAGMWAVRHLRSEGRNASVLVRGVDADSFNGSAVAYRYAQMRLAEVTRAGNSEIILSSSRSLFEMRRKLRQGHCVIGLMDVPVQQSQACLSGQLLGRTAYFPRGLLNLALNSEAKVVVYSVGIDPDSGDRMLEIGEPLVFGDETQLLSLLTHSLNLLIERDSAAWHHWGGVQVFFDKIAAA